MNKQSFPKTLILSTLLALCGCTLQAQTKPEFSIKKIESAFVETPQFSAGSYRKQQPGAQRPLPWLEVDLSFERDEVSKEASKFADNLVVNFYILLNNGSLSVDKKPTLLVGAVTVSDVPYGKGLHVAAFVSPQSLARFFEGKPPASFQQAVVDVGATLSNANGVVAISSSKSTEVARQGKGWWEEDAAMNKVSGRILDKSQTPFAPLAWDYYLPSKSQSAN
ncbi:MAG: Amuc_1102 family pilus-like protein [bacterium]